MLDDDLSGEAIGGGLGPAHFRAEYVGWGTLADRQQKLNRHLHELMRFADMNNSLILVTNQVMAKPDTFLGGGRHTPPSP